MIRTARAALPSRSGPTNGMLDSRSIQPHVRSYRFADSAFTTFPRKSARKMMQMAVSA
jgi:hypothetical protein